MNDQEREKIIQQAQIELGDEIVSGLLNDDMATLTSHSSGKKIRFHLLGCGEPMSFVDYFGNSHILRPIILEEVYRHQPDAQERFEELKDREQNSEKGVYYDQLWGEKK